MWRIIQRCFSGHYVTQKGWISTINNSWTPNILVALSIILVVARYVEQPVQCWCPAEFKSSMVTYTNNYCWLSRAMYHYIGDDFLSPETVRITPENPSLNRWIPLVFLLQAILFKLPGMFMYVGESKLGLKRTTLHGLSDGYTTLSLQDRVYVGKQLSRYINQWLKNRIFSGLPFGLFTFLIVAIYVLYAVNVTAQLILLDLYIKDPNATTYGRHLVHNLFANRSTPWIESPVFTKIFLCDFRIRKLATVQHYTVQCISNINFVNEQMIAFFWILLVLTTLVTYCSCALKFAELIWPFTRTRYVKQYLQSENITIHNESDVSRFANNFLGEDGVMVLKGIGEISSEYLVRDAVVKLWITNFGQRGVPRQVNQTVQYNRPEQTPLQQRPMSQPNHNESSSVGGSAGPRKEEMLLVQYPHKA